MSKRKVRMTSTDAMHLWHLRPEYRRELRRRRQQQAPHFRGPGPRPKIPPLRGGTIDCVRIVRRAMGERPARLYSLGMLLDRGPTYHEQGRYFRVVALRVREKICVAMGRFETPDGWRGSPTSLFIGYNEDCTWEALPE